MRVIMEDKDLATEEKEIRTEENNCDEVKVDSQSENEDVETIQEELDPKDQELKILREKLTEANIKVDELNNKFLRAAADNENYRKRMVREREELQHRTTSRVIEEILPAIDNMKLGLSASDIHPEAKILADGFVMVFEQLKNALSQLGVDEIDASPKDNFDPNSHECLSQQASEEIDENKIIATTRSGYRLNGKLLRPAAVILSTGPLIEDSAESVEKKTEEKQEA
jgi:molecular chaperone GrpE